MALLTKKKKTFLPLRTYQIKYEVPLLNGFPQQGYRVILFLYIIVIYLLILLICIDCKYSYFI